MFKADVIEGAIVRFVMARRFLWKDLYFSACYLADGLLIDSGIPLMGRSLAKALSHVPLSAVVNTHAHEDHMGGNAILQMTRRIPAFAHRDAIPVFADPKKLSLLPYQKLYFGEPAPSSCDPLGETFQAGRHRFRIIHSPGHSPDHVSLFEEDKGWLFSGDAYIGGHDRVFRKSYDIREMTRTLGKLASLEAEVMFTGKGSVVRKPRRMIERKLSYFEGISQKVLNLHREGIAESEIAHRLFPGDLGVRLVTSGDFSAIHLVRSLIRNEDDRQACRPG